MFDKIYDSKLTVLGHGFIVKNISELTTIQVVKKLTKKFKKKLPDDIKEYTCFELTELICNIFGDECGIYVNDSLGTPIKTWFISINNVSFAVYGKGNDYIKKDKLLKRVDKIDSHQQKSLEKLHDFFEEFCDVTEIDTYFYTFMY